MGAARVLAAPKASAMEIIGICRHTKERRRELRALRTLVQEVKDLTQTLRGPVRSAKQRKATEQ